jgi:hypothetical protein
MGSAFPQSSTSRSRDMELWRRVAIALGLGGLVGGGVWYVSAALRSSRIMRAVRPGAAKPATGLTFWVTGSLDPGWVDALQFFDFTTAKLVDGTDRSPASDWQTVQEASTYAGIPMHGWGWAYARSHEEAAREGAFAAEAALEANVPAYWVNAEKHWLIPEHGASSDPVGVMATYVQAFRAVAPEIILVNNCMTGWSSTRIRDREVELIQLFDVYGPMIYAANKTDGNPKTQAKKWKRAADLARRARRPWCPMLATGRISTKDGNIWGNLEGAVELQREYPADWITFWVGPNPGPRFTSRNHVNMALAEFPGAVHA